MSTQTITQDSPSEAQHKLLAELTPWMATWGRFSLIAQDARTLVYTRQYRPTWAIWAAVIGAFVFLLGLLFLLVKDTQTVTVSISPTSVGGKALVRVNGEMSSSITDKIETLLA